MIWIIARLQAIVFATIWVHLGVRFVEIQIIHLLNVPSNWWGSASVPTAGMLDNAADPSYLTEEPNACNAPITTWGDDGIVQIEFNNPIPVFERPYGDCTRSGDESTRENCAILAFNQYKDQLGGSITWGQFASLVMYSEGHPILLGNTSSGNLVLQNPQVSGLGICWRLTGTDTWNQGQDQCNVMSITAPGVQSDFVYAVWEWIFNECAKGAGFVDYIKDGTQYNKECNERGLVTFLAQVQSLYQDTAFNKNPNLYLTLAEQEFAQWGWHPETGRYHFGVCPCTWGNVAYQLPDDASANNANPERSARRNDGKPSINNGWSFSYFAWNIGKAPNPSLRFFKVY